MNNALYVGLSRQMTLQREMDVIANNIANSETVGFKVENLKLETDSKTPQTQDITTAKPQAINFVHDVGVDRDYGQGSVRQTGGTFDLALQGEGFFQVNTANGIRYTRDGRFTLDSKSQLVDIAGDTLQGTGGPITVDPLKNAPVIAQDGAVTQVDPATGVATVIGRLAIMKFADTSGLQKSDSGLYDNTSNVTPQAAQGTKILQGMLENSNVDQIQMMTRMIAVSRAYEQVANMMSQTGDTSDQSIQRLGRVN